MAKARVKVPATAAAGEVITIRSLINHRMESGQRTDGEGREIPRDIVNRFAAFFEGERFFAVDIGPGVSANPFLEFRARVDRAGTFRFEWTDDAGAVTALERDIALRS